MTRRMIWNQTAYLGASAVSVVSEELVRRGFTKALAVSDRVLLDSGETAA